MSSSLLVLWILSVAVLSVTISADTSAIKRLQTQFPGAAVYNFVLTSGDGSALNAATCNAVERNTTKNIREDNEILINGQFPGPLVRVKKNQLLVVRVENQMSEATVTIHWHGFVQHGTPYADGAAMVSQCPLRPRGGEFIYVMNATNAGSFFYHGHIRTTPLTLYGMLIVEDEDYGVLPNWPTPVKREVSMLLSDAWTKSPNDLAAGLQAPNLIWIGNPRVLLVNGRTRFPYTKAQASPGCGHPVIHVERNIETLWRVVGATTLGFLSVAIEGHKFVILRSDLQLVEPLETKILEVNSGQRYDVLVVKDTPAYTDSKDEYWIHVRMMTRTNATETWSVLTYTNETSVLANVDPPSNYRSVVAEAVEIFGGMEQSLRPFPGVHTTIPPAQMEYVIDTMQKNASVNAGPMQWQVNGMARGTPMKYPLIWYTNEMTRRLQQGNSRESVMKWLHDAIPNPAQRPLVVEEGQVIQFVIQNRVATNKICEQHPYHLHFGEFAIVARGKGAYIPGSIPVNAVVPVKETMWRDTVTMFASNHTIWDPPGVYGDPCGWVAVRAKIETPGASIFHCHIASHMIMGMSTFMIVLPTAGNNMPLPKSIPGFASEATQLAVDCERYLHDVEGGIDS